MKYDSIRKAVAAAAETYGAEAVAREISSVTYSRAGSMTVRCVKNGRSGYAVSEQADEASAEELVRIACENALIIDDEDTVGLFGGSERYETVEEPACEIPDADALKAHTMALQTRALAASDKVVEGTQSATSGGRRSRVFFNSLGLDLSYEHTDLYHYVGAAVKDGEDAANDYRIKRMSEESVEDTADKCVEDTLAKLGADTVPSGKYRVIFDSYSMRSLLGTFSSIFSARSAFLKTTLLAGKEGQPVAAANVSIVDDPFHPAKFGHCPFDAEGVATRRLDVVRNGVLQTLLYNRMFAKQLGGETTGNAADAKTVSPNGLFLAAGDLSKEALLAKLGNGLYITNLMGMHAGANVQSGDFSLQAEGFVVEDGVKVRAAKNFTVACNFYEMLKQVEDLSDTVDFGAFGNFGSPDVLVRDISVSGK